MERKPSDASDCSWREIIPSPFLSRGGFEAFGSFGAAREAGFGATGFGEEVG